MGSPRIPDEDPNEWCKFGVQWFVGGLYGRKSLKAKAWNQASNFVKKPAAARNRGCGGGGLAVREKVKFLRFEFGGTFVVPRRHQSNRNRKVARSRQVTLWIAIDGFLITQHRVVDRLIEKAIQHPLQFQFPVQRHDIVSERLMPQETPEVFPREQQGPD